MDADDADQVRSKRLELIVATAQGALCGQVTEEFAEIVIPKVWLREE